jgi:hypothetical protein
MSFDWSQAAGPITGALTGAVVSGIWAFVTQRRIEAERRVASQALEVLKAQLTFDAEVLRQAAGKKVAALLKIDEATISLLRVLLNADRDHNQRREAVTAWGHEMVYAEALLGPEALAEMGAFQQSIGTADQTLMLKEIATETVAPIKVVQAHAEIEEARKRLVGMIRRELQIVKGALVAGASGNKGKGALSDGRGARTGGATDVP